MNESLRLISLRLFMRVLSVGFLAAFIPWITLILLNAPVLARPAVVSHHYSDFNPTTRATRA
jgi:hypothetical protein